MKRCSQCLQDKSDASFYIRKNLKSGLSCWCKQCSCEKGRSSMAALRSNDKFVQQERGKARLRYKTNPAKHKAKVAKWRSENPEKHKQQRAQWWGNNPGSRNASRMKRHTVKLQATPAWANKFFISEIYHLAKLREKTVGGKWHVDHIVPLQSEIVCGLHTERNLQLLSAHQNRIKNNRVWPDMP